MANDSDPHALAECWCGRNHLTDAVKEMSVTVSPLTIALGRDAIPAVTAALAGCDEGVEQDLFAAGAFFAAVFLATADRLREPGQSLADAWADYALAFAETYPEDAA